MMSNRLLRRNGILDPSSAPKATRPAGQWMTGRRRDALIEPGSGRCGDLPAPIASVFALNLADALIPGLGPVLTKLPLCGLERIA